jgi:hypothetical protein
MIYELKLSLKIKQNKLIVIIYLIIDKFMLNINDVNTTETKQEKIFKRTDQRINFENI